MVFDSSNFSFCLTTRIPLSLFNECSAAATFTERLLLKWKKLDWLMLTMIDTTNSTIRFRIYFLFVRDSNIKNKNGWFGWCRIVWSFNLFFHGSISTIDTIQFWDEFNSQSVNVEVRMRTGVYVCACVFFWNSNVTRIRCKRTVTAITFRLCAIVCVCERKTKNHTHLSTLSLCLFVWYNTQAHATNTHTTTLIRSNSDSCWICSPKALHRNS